MLGYLLQFRILKDEAQAEILTTTIFGTSAF